MQRLDKILSEAGVGSRKDLKSLSAYNCEIRDVFLLTCEPGGKLYLSIREDAT